MVVPGTLDARPSAQYCGALRLNIVKWDTFVEWGDILEIGGYGISRRNRYIYSN